MTLSEFRTEEFCDCWFRFVFTPKVKVILHAKTWTDTIPRRHTLHYPGRLVRQVGTDYRTCSSGQWTPTVYHVPRGSTSKGPVGRPRLFVITTILSFRKSFTESLRVVRRCFYSNVCTYRYLCVVTNFKKRVISRSYHLRKSV